MIDAETLSSICDELATGKSLRQICRERGLVESTARYHLKNNEDHFAQYTRARELQADSYFDQVLEIADDKTMSADDRRIAIDARKWAAGKLHGKYSDKVKHVGGDEGDNPIALTGFDIKFV